MTAPCFWRYHEFRRGPLGKNLPAEEGCHNNADIRTAIRVDNRAARRAGVIAFSLFPQHPYWLLGDGGPN